jgi:hypothetical protein
MNTDMSEMRATMKVNRAARKAMADSRAMEEQMERENPLSGSGATPSMGLSQVRGGKKMMKNAAAQGKMLMEHLGSLHGSGYAKQFHEGMKGAGFFGDLGIPIVSDVAGMFGLGKCETSGGLHTGQYEGEGAVSDIGHKLSDMLPENYSQFGHTVSNLANKYLGLGKPMKGGFMGLAMMALPLISKLLGAGKMSQGAHDQMKKMIEDHEKKHHSGEMKGGFMGLAMMALPLISKLLGAGEMTKGAADQLKKVLKDRPSGTHKMMGSGRAVGAGHCDGGRMGPVPYGRPQRPVMELMDGGMSFSEMMKKQSGINNDHSHNIKGGLPDPLEYQKMREKMTGKKEPMVAYGKPKKEKRVVGAGDGRRKRAEVVRKVMAEKGMKMIEASKYVKEHGLYKP